MACPTEINSAFTPESALNTVASTRIGSSDLQGFLESIDIDNLASFDFQNEILSGGYLVGLLVPTIIILVIFLLISIALCFAKVTCARCCKGDSIIGLIIFWGFCVASCLGWFISIGAIAELRQGVSGVIDSVECAFDIATSTLDGINDAEQILLDSESLGQIATVTCANAVSSSGSANLTLPEFPNITALLGDSLDEFRSVEQTVRDVDSQVEEITNLIRTGLPIFSVVVIVFVVVVIVIIAIFAFTTTVGVIRVLGKEDCLKRYTYITCTAQFLRKVSAFAVFFIGYILVLIFIIFISLSSILVILGADVCVPSPTENIQEIATILYQKVGDLPLNSTVCDDPTLSLVCHYQTCTGVNPVEDQLDEILDEVNSTAIDASQQFIDELSEVLSEASNEVLAVITNLSDINATCISNDTAVCVTSCDQAAADALCALNSTFVGVIDSLNQCNSDADDVLSKANELVPSVAALIDNLRCEALTPVYQKLVEDELCNNVFNGLALTYIALLLASFSLLCAMFVFRTMDLRPFEDQDFEYNGKVQDAQAVISK